MTAVAAIAAEQKTKRYKVITKDDSFLLKGCN